MMCVIVKSAKLSKDADSTIHAESPGPDDLRALRCCYHIAEAYIERVSQQGYEEMPPQEESMNDHVKEEAVTDEARKNEGSLHSPHTHVPQTHPIVLVRMKSPDLPGATSPELVWTGSSSLL